jgi:hypothetical protein
LRKDLTSIGRQSVFSFIGKTWRRRRHGARLRPVAAPSRFAAPGRKAGYISPLVR